MGWCVWRVWVHLFRSQRARLNAWSWPAALQHIPANGQQQHRVLKSPTQKTAISDMKTTPLLGKMRLKKNMQIPKRNLFLIPLDNRILEKSMWPCDQGRGKPAWYNILKSGWESRNYFAERQKPYTKEYIRPDSLYMKFKNWRNLLKTNRKKRQWLPRLGVGREHWEGTWDNFLGW